MLPTHTHNSQQVKIDSLILRGIGWVYIPAKSLVGGIGKVIVMNGFVYRVGNGNAYEKEAS